jgi:Domain of unknown function (DUF1929)
VESNYGEVDPLLPVLSLQAGRDPGGIAPPGHYMLFVVDANGAPSIARIIRIS